MEEQHNLIIFENDDEFFDWCVNPNLVFKKSESGVTYFTWEFTSEYLNALNEGRIFTIKDSDCICKRQAISFHTVTKEVENLKEYTPLLIKMNK